MVRATAADVQKNFGLYTDKARQEPVTVTKHGRDSVVILSAEAYERLKSFDTREVYSVEDMPDDVAEAILNAKVPAWTAKYNHELEE